MSSLFDLPTGRRPACCEIARVPLNLPLLRSGRLPDPDAANEVAVNEPRAVRRREHSGDRVTRGFAPEGIEQRLNLGRPLLDKLADGMHPIDDLTGQAGLRFHGRAFTPRLYELGGICV